MEAVPEILGLEALWRSSAGGDRSVRIAIIDGPVDRSHPSLRDAALQEALLDGGAVWSDVRSEHGTHVTSIVMGQPGSPVLGVAPSCTAIVSSIYREAPGGQLEPTSQAQVARAINGAVQQGADIINISSGQLTRTGQAERILADAVRRSAAAGALIVAAAGNDGCRCLHVPAALEGVLAVGACNPEGRPLPFSNFGDDYLANGILAPGQNVRGAAPGGGVVERSGTSYATPIVTGVVALFLSLLRQRGQSASPQAVRAALLAGAAPCTNDSDSPRCLAGRLDIEGAAKLLLGEGAGPPESVKLRGPPIAITASDAAADADHRLSVQNPSSREGGMSESAGKIPGQGRPDAAQPSVTPSGASGAEGNVSISAADAPASVGAEAAPAGAPAHGAAQPAQQGTAPSAMQGAAMPSATAPNMMVMPMPMPWFGQPGVMPQAGYPFTPSGLAMPAAPQAATAPAMPALARGEPGAFAPSAGNCECGTVRPSQADSLGGELVFVIGKLFYDFGTEARLDYFHHEIAAWRDSLVGRGDPAFGPDRDRAGDVAAPYNPEVMARFLLNMAPGESADLSQMLGGLPYANALIWTVNIDNVPVYAADPKSVFGVQIFQTYIFTLWFQDVSPDDPRSVRTLVKGLEETELAKLPPGWPTGLIERVSQGGEIVGTTTLLNGSVVPTIAPAWRGTYSWNIYDILGVAVGDVNAAWLNRNPWAQELRGFLERIYNEFRNVGVSPQDRALNYSAMNARYTKQIFREMLQGSMRLDTVEVDRSTICRPESDCWDVTYRFFDPMNVLTKSRQVFQYTIDVSDIVPVAVGPLRRWQVA